MSSTVKTPKHFRFAVTVFHNAQPLDFIGPLDVLNSLSPDHHTVPSGYDFSFETVLLAATMEPVTLNGGMAIVPHMTYEQARKEHWDGVLVPGGKGARPGVETNQATIDFLEFVVPKCQYVLTGESGVSPCLTRQRTSEVESFC
jgi:transcriptional regulator GlxA family with amidase domain